MLHCRRNVHTLHRTRHQKGTWEHLCWKHSATLLYFFNNWKSWNSDEVYSGCSSAEERQFDWVFLEMGRNKRESFEFHLFIGLVIFLCFPFSYCQGGIWKWNMYFDQLSFSSPLEHILLVFAFPDFGQERRRHRLPDWLFFPDELLNTTVERDQERREEEGIKKKTRTKRREKEGACSVPGRAKNQEFDGRGLGNASRKKSGVLEAGGKGSMHWREGEGWSERVVRELGGTKIWGPSQSSFPDLLSGWLLQHLHPGGVSPNEDASSLTLSTHRVPAHSHPPSALTLALTHRLLVPR